MIKIWIIGAGRFGLRAVDALINEFSDAHITLVDRKIDDDPTDLSRVQDVCLEDGIGFLLNRLDLPELPDWIVPAIPIHVAYRWIMSSLQNVFSIKPIEIPRAVIELLPNPMDGSDGSVYTSNADFMCPEDCAEPEGICTCTGQPRPRTLYEFLSEIRHRDFSSIVVQSRQLTPGVGGYKPKQLFEALSLAREKTGSILLSTACKCHGVMNAFEFEG